MKGGPMGGMMKQIQKMQQDMMKAQEELADLEVTATSGGGMVTVTVNGHMKVLKVILNEEIVKEGDKEMLEDLIVAAVNNGVEKAQELMQKEMSKITGGLPIPNIF